MRKSIISIITVFAMAISNLPITSAETKVELNFRNQGITDEKLAEMVESGEIPKSTVKLNLGRNQISDITPLNQLTNLQWLNLYDNHIESVFPLGNLTKLQALYLGNNLINDISSLSTLTNLEILSLNHNQITDITPLANLTNLGGPFGALDLGKNLITDISPLANLTKLEWLSLDNNLITDLSPLYKLENLTFYTLDGNPVSDDEVALLRLALQKADFVGRVLAGEPTIEDALEVLKYLAGMNNYLDRNVYAFYAACITGGDEPSIADVLEILKHLAGMKSVFGGGT